jgi:hypothetical protein
LKKELINALPIITQKGDNFVRDKINETTGRAVDDLYGKFSEFTNPLLLQCNAQW